MAHHSTPEPLPLEEQVGRGLLSAGGFVAAAYKAKHFDLGEDFEPPAFGEFCTTGAGGKPMFAASLLGKHILSMAPVAIGGRSLYVYQDGVYQREGEEVLRNLIATILADRWKNMYANETVAWLTARAKPLNESPPISSINVRNGLLTVTKSSAKLAPHDPRLLSPIQLPVVYNPAARCPNFMRFLRGMQPDEDLRNLLIEYMGYLLVPDNSYQKALMLHGPGGNGRSTLLNVITALLGSDNVSNHQLQSLAEGRFESADLYGKLANICADITAEELRHSGLFKAITGGDEIQAEHKHVSSFKFKPFARLLFSANELPSARDGSEAFYDRWLVVPCTQRIRNTTRQDAHILQSLTNERELSGVLNLALQGLMRLNTRQRFLLRHSGEAARKHFRQRADSVAGFVYGKRGAFKVDEWYPRTAIYSCYRDVWCHEEGRQAMSSTRFYDRFTELVLVDERGRQGVDGFVVVQWPRESADS